MRQEQPTVLNCDNQSCITIAKNPVFHARMKHIEIQYHFVRDMIVSEEVKIIYYPMTENYTDIFTKALCIDKPKGFFPGSTLGPDTSLPMGGH